MRLWTLHPTYLDSQGLVALWREALLARAVLRGRTKGYRHHPQLERFISSRSPCAAINGYLASIYAEAALRGYQFDRSKLGRAAKLPAIRATHGQLRYEWGWLYGSCGGAVLHATDSTLRCPRRWRILFSAWSRAQLPSGSGFGSQLHPKRASNWTYGSKRHPQTPRKNLK